VEEPEPLFVPEAPETEEAVAVESA
jgi:hypothetical protein